MESAVTAAAKVLLDSEALERTLSRIAHEIIERNPDLDRTALVGIHTRGVPLAQRLRRLILERAGEEVAIGTVLADRGHRELPIRPDYVGKNLPTARGEHVQVQLLEVDEVDRVVLLDEK
jgi:pyrimidine operon attenuation protein/uracil phosphoribosyltransferase